MAAVALAVPLSACGSEDAAPQPTISVPPAAPDTTTTAAPTTSSPPPVETTTSTAPPTTSPPPPPPAPSVDVPTVAPFTCADVYADTGALVDGFAAVMGEMDVYAEHPDFMALGRPAVAQLVGACGADWAIEVANNITGSTFRATEALIQDITASGGT